MGGSKQDASSRIAFATIIASQKCEEHFNANMIVNGPKGLDDGISTQ
jgi:hypothetical protein